MEIKLPLKLLLLSFHILISSVCAQTYYITPTQNGTCPNGSTPCTTLSENINHNIMVQTSDLNLLLLPGNHILDFSLTFFSYYTGNISISIVPYEDPYNDETETTTITCEQSGGIAFNMRQIGFRTVREDVSVTVRDLTLKNCSLYSPPGVNVDSLKLYIKKCHFFGQANSSQPSSQALVLNFAHVQIVNCSFSNYIFNLGLSEPTGSVTMVTTMIQISNSIAVFNETVFSNINMSAAVNSLITIQGGSAVTIRNSEFSQIEASKDGGTFVSVSFSDFEMESTSFNNIKGNRKSLISLLQGGMGTIKNCRFDQAMDNNEYVVTIEAYLYGVLVLDNTIFSNNNNSGLGPMLQIERTGLTLRNCDFTNNTVASTLIASIVRFVGPGTFTISDTTLRNNNLQGLYVGVIDIFSATFVSSGVLTIQNNVADYVYMYIVESTGTFSGAMTWANNEGSIYIFLSSVTFNGVTVITNNSFSVNYNGVLPNSLQGIDGGPITSYQSNINCYGSVEITNNRNNVQLGGAIAAVESNFYLNGNVLIAGNFAAVSAGAIYALRCELNFMNRTIIANNRAETSGGGVVAVGTRLQLSGIGSTLVFVNNSAHLWGGGALFTNNARLYIIKDQQEFSDDKDQWLRVEFTRNSALQGGAIYVNDSTNSGTCGATPTSTSECFLQVLRGYVIFSAVNTSEANYVNVYFTNNTAMDSGDSLFGGLLDRCTINKLTAEVRLKEITMVRSGAEYFTSISNASLDHVSSLPVRVCACDENNQPSCNQTSRIISSILVQKGQSFKVSLTAVDQTGKDVPATILSSLRSGSGQLGDGQFNQFTYGKCTKLEFKVSSPLNSDEINLYAEGPCNSDGISKGVIDIQFLPCSCPIGFEVTSNDTDCICGCDSNLSQYITECNIEDMSIIRVGRFWFSNDESRAYGIHPVCPFNYCKEPSERVVIFLNSPNGSDAQCAFNRSGILCGACSDGQSVTFGSSQCKACSNNWIVLLIVFAIAGVALVAFLLTFNLTVAVGTLNGLIFYANLVGVNSSTLLPFKRPNFSTIFIAWLNLDFGFEACFYDGMDTYVKTWLRLAFPAYIICLVIAIIAISKYSQKFSRLLSSRNPVATLATLILLSYASLLRTVITIYSPATIQYFNGSSQIVWFVDGSVPYFGKKHIFLSVVASVIVILGLVYTLFLFSWQWLIRCPDKCHLRWIRNSKLYSFMDAYSAPFNLKYRYWTGFLLLVRVILYIVLVPNIGDNPSTGLFAVICVCCCIVLLKIVQGKLTYRSRLLEIVENVFLFNGILFCAATYHVKMVEGNQAILAHVSVSIAFVTFLIILIYHSFKYICPKHFIGKLKTHLSLRMKRSKKDDTPTLQNSRSSKSHLCAREQLAAELLEIADDSNSFSQLDYQPLNSVTVHVHEPKKVTQTVIDGILYEPELYDDDSAVKMRQTT